MRPQNTTLSAAGSVIVVTTSPVWFSTVVVVTVSRAACKASLCGYQCREGVHVARDARRLYRIALAWFCLLTLPRQGTVRYCAHGHSPVPSCARHDFHAYRVLLKSFGRSPFLLKLTGAVAVAGGLSSQAISF